MCPVLANGKIQCQGSSESQGYYQDNCTFACNTDFELQGPNNGTCLANQSWSKGNPECVAGLCITVCLSNCLKHIASYLCRARYPQTCKAYGIAM